MKSIMLNQKNSTFIKFYILVHVSIYQKQKEVIDSICQEHINCNITYFILKNEFKDISTKGRIKRTTAIYYRLLIQNLLKNEKKALYFDCDILVYKDLNQFYNYNISDKYYLGQYEGRPIRKYGKHLRDFINSGAILINLENLRKDNIYEKIYAFLKRNNKKLKFLDQDAINVVCNEKNKFLPPYYVSSGVCNSNTFKALIKNKINNSKIIQNLKEPYIFHFKRYPKPWHRIAKNKNLVCFDFFHRFYEYARKSNYYFEILENFKVHF